MEQLSLTKRLKIVSLYFSGLSFGQVAAKAGVSKGSVANIVQELKAGIFPEAADLVDQIESLRELAVDLAKIKKTPAQAVMGVALLRRMNELGLDPGHMEHWPLLLNAIKGPDDAQELINAAYTVRYMEKEYGTSVAGVGDRVKKLGDKAKELETVTAKIGAAKEEINNLTKKMGDLKPVISSQEYKLKWLIPRVEELEKREKLLLEHHESRLVDAAKAEETLSSLKIELKRLAKTGLSIEALANVNVRLEAVSKRHGIKPDQIQNRLLSELRRLDKGLGLETFVKSQQQAVNQLSGQVKTLEAAVGSLSQQKQDLELGIKEITHCVITQIKGVIPVAEDAAARVAGDLQDGCREALTEIHRLRDESIEVGKDIGEYRGVLDESDWVQKLLALVRGENAVTPGDVRAVALLTVGGISAWMGQHGKGSLDVQIMSASGDKLLGQLRQWQVCDAQ